MDAAPASDLPVTREQDRREDPGRLAAVAALGVLIAVAVAQTSDLLTFIRMVSVAGIAAELNPIVALGATSLGIVPLVLAKVALVVLVAASFAVVARSHRRVAATVATTGMVAGLIGAFSNVLAIT